MAEKNGYLALAAQIEVLINTYISEARRGEAYGLTFIDRDSGRMYGNQDYDDTAAGRPRSFMSDDTLIKEHFRHLKSKDLGDQKDTLIDLLSNLENDQWRALRTAIALNSNNISDSCANPDS